MQHTERRWPPSLTGKTHQRPAAGRWRGFLQSSKVCAGPRSVVSHYKNFLDRRRGRAGATLEEISMNGVAALQAPEPAPSGEIEQHIAVAVADAVSVLSRGMIEYWSDGKITSATKMAGSEQIANLYGLAQAAPAGVDFAAVARAECRRILQER